MKKALALFLVGALVLAGLALCAIDSHVAWNGRKIVMAGVILVLGGFVIYF